MEFNMNTYIIAEIGINHNGDLSVAKKLIKAAKDAGADAVKFQKRTPEIVTPEHIWERIRNDTPWGDIRYIDYRRKIEFWEDEYREIDRYCKGLDIEWFASPWDVPSVRFLEKFKVGKYKVASAMLTNWELLEAIADTKKQVIISKGGSTMAELKKAVKMFFDPIVLHCVAKYPCPPENLNLKDISFLQRTFPRLTVGYSGHEIGIATSVAAVVLGAEVIERHITLDRSMWGSDQSASLEPQGFARMVRDIRTVEKALGGGGGLPQEIEQESMRKLRYHAS
jgi:N-acetylneuraminate synthase